MVGYDGPIEPAPSRRRKRKPRGDWRDELIVNADGNPRACLANAATALRLAPDFDGALQYNLFADRVTLRRPPPWDAEARTPRDWAEHDDLHLAEWLQTAGVMVTPGVAAEAVQTVASENPHDPPRDYLDCLKWDGTERLDFWLTRHLGAENTDYTRAVGRRFLISAVARIMRPGVKADCVLVLEGPQGAGKSSALRALAEPWFTDEVAEFGSKDAAEQLAGAWLIEISELESLTRAGVERVKAFASRNADRFRPAYGRRVRDFPRRCVFAGTVNRADYLRDETGGRRFWPVRCGRIHLDELRKARDQLWAEAVAAWRAGEVWWLDESSVARAAAEEQAARYHGDPWDEAIGDYLDKLRRKQDGDHISTSIDDILSDVIRIEAGRRDQAAANRVARSLRLHGWDRFQIREADGRRVWKYRPVTGDSP